MIEIFRDLIITISIALTIPFLCYCVEILYVWWPSVRETFRTSNGVLAASGHLARGIWIGFAANFLDNFYWMITWFLILFRHPMGLLMLMAGSLANIFFRQLGGIMAAREHTVAASAIHKRSSLQHVQKFYWYAGFCVLLGLALARFL